MGSLVAGRSAVITNAVPRTKNGQFQLVTSCPTSIACRFDNDRQVQRFESHVSKKRDALSFESRTRLGSNHAQCRRLHEITKLQRQMTPRPRDARRLVCTNATTEGPSFVGRIIQKVLRFLPGKAIAEKIEAEVDAAAGLIQLGAKMVVDLADEVEKLANDAELRAEEVERIARKVQEVTTKAQKVVDSVADVVEGETSLDSLPTLKETGDQLDKVAATTKKAEEGSPTERRSE